MIFNISRFFNLFFKINTSAISRASATLQYNCPHQFFYINQNTSLHIACSSVHFPIVQYLIEKGANIEAKDKNQHTPLYVASEEGYLPTVQYLIERGANVEAKTREGKNPLHIVSYLGYSFLEF